jgi:AraC-like DNA-binding protein
VLRQCRNPAEPSMIEPKLSRIRYSTDDLPAGRRFALWSEGFVHRHMDMEFVDLSANGLRFTADFVPLGGGIAAGILRGTPSAFIRKPMNGNDALLVVINRLGSFRFVQQDRQFDLSVGDAAVLDGRRRAELHCLEDGEAWSLRLPREALRHLIRDVEQTIEQYIPASNSALRILGGYLETLFTLDEIVEPGLSGVHIADLVASALGAHRDAQASIEDRGIRAARLRALLDAIARSAADTDLDPARTAEQLGLSVRYVHRLLQETGKTFSAHVLERRLDRAHRLLRDPRLAYLKISEIASAAGFSDLSHFNRSFRRFFAETPSQARTAAARKEESV